MPKCLMSKIILVIGHLVIGICLPFDVTQGNPELVEWVRN